MTQFKAAKLGMIPGFAAFLFSTLTLQIAFHLSPFFPTFAHPFKKTYNIGKSGTYHR